MNRLSGGLTDIRNTDDQSLAKSFERRRQGRQLRRVHRVENTADFLLILVEHDRQLRLRAPRRRESDENGQFRRYGRLDTDVGVDRMSVELNRDADAVRANRQRFATHWIGKKGKTQSFLSCAFGILDCFSLRDSLRNIRKAHRPIPFLAPLDQGAIKIGSHLHIPCFSKRFQTRFQTSVKTKRFPDLGCGLRIDFSARQGRNAISDPDHRMAALATSFRNAERQLSSPSLISQLRNEPVSLVHDAAPQPNWRFGQICPAVKPAIEIASPVPRGYR